MELKQVHKEILNAKICPYCGASTKYISEEQVYGRAYKNRLMICCNNFPSCDSYVGTHDDGEPLGRLANKELRLWKKKAHDSFDKLWRNKKSNRGIMYKELSIFLNIPSDYCHIGMFKKETCMKVIKWSENYKK